MIRVLQCVNIMDRAGLETMLMNYYRKIDRTQIQFDFLTHREEKGAYDDEIINMGGKVYHAPRLYPQNYPKYFKWMKRFFQEHPEYKIVHSHIDSMSYLPLLAAKKAGIPVRIAHSHNTKIQVDFKYILKQYFRLRINSVCNYRFACGEEAGKHLFGDKKFKIIPNAIDANRFFYSELIREKKREELGLNSRFVVGHVGRFTLQKNHIFLVKVFLELFKRNPSAVLMLIGDGEKKEEILNIVCDNKMENNVIFLGNRPDVNELYQAMDVFVMPSLFEGLPVVGVEAQFSDLPCIFSNKVTKEVEFNGKCKFIGLDESTAVWSEQILSMSNLKRGINTSLLDSNYNIENAYQLLENFYNGLYEELE